MIVLETPCKTLTCEELTMKPDPKALAVTDKEEGRLMLAYVEPGVFELNEKWIVVAPGDT